MHRYTEIFKTRKGYFDTLLLSFHNCSREYVAETACLGSIEFCRTTNVATTFWAGVELNAAVVHIDDGNRITFISIKFIFGSNTGKRS